jgi:hypothetical protein
VRTDHDDIDSFAIPIGTGMSKAVHPPYDPAAQDALTAQFDEFGAVRNRGAVEARSAWLRPPPK